MGYYTDLVSGAGLAFVGVMMDVVANITGILPAPAAATIGTLSYAFVGIGSVIITFGLYERFFVKNLKPQMGNEVKAEAVPE
jgi:hypothetical protein